MPRIPALVFALTVSIVALAVLVRTTPTTSADPALDSEEQAFITLLNNYRSQHDLSPLSIDWGIMPASEWMSGDMGAKGYFDHNDSLGRDPWVRMCDFGYCYNTYKGENIAAGYTTAQAVFDAWRASPTHDDTMLSPYFKSMGLARVYTAGSPLGWYWTNDFGGVKTNAPPPGSATATPSRTPSLTPSRTPSPTPSLSPSPTPSRTPSPTPSRTPSPTPSRTPSPTPSRTPSPTPTLTPSPTPTLTPSLTPTLTPSLTPSPSASATQGPTGVTDSDGDGYTDSLEAFVGTNRLRACPNTQAGNDEPDTIPVDFDDDGTVTGRDFLSFTYVLGAGIDKPPEARHDLTMDGRVNGSDLLSMGSTFGRDWCD